MPTYLTTVGRFGAAIADRLAADPPSPAFAVYRVRGPQDLAEADRPQVLPRYREAMAAELGPLLRAAATSGDGSGGRLDLVLVADIAEVGGPIVTALAQAMSEVLATKFAVMFPPDTAPDQRSVGLVVVLATPAIDRSEGGASAIEALGQLEAWHAGGPPSPILNRILVLPRQNEVMPLSADDVERAVALFVSAAYRAGLRDSDQLRSRLGPPRDPGRIVDAFAVAAADVDVPHLVNAFGWRSSLAALARLASQCEGKGSPHVPELDVDGWLGPLHNEPPATTLTAKAGAASPSELEAMIRAVDVAEGEAVSRARRAVHDVVDTRLGGDEALVAYSAVQQGLARAAEQAAAAAKPTGTWIPSAETVAQAEAEDAADQAAEAAPPAPDVEPAKPPSPVMTGVLLGLCAGAATAAVSAVASVRASATAGGAGAKVVAAATPIGADATMSLIWGAIALVVVAAAWIGLGKLLAKKAKDDADEAKQKVVTPRAARNRRKVAALEAALAVRRRRAARAAEITITDERTRLEGMRGAVLAAGAKARAQLADLGVAPADDPAGDDYARLWDAETPLHLALLPTSALAKLWALSRNVREDDVWAARLLTKAWPRGGHRDDLPFGEGGTWQQLARDQHELLTQTGAFEWPEIAAAIQTQIQRLLATAPGALGLGVRPRSPDGTPETLHDARELLIVVPPEGRAAVDRALSIQPIGDARVMTGPRGMSRVLILKTAGAMSTTALARGMK